MASQIVNNKSCAQCECVFKKSQKSMNCHVCKYWFCLDCSHVSAKLYDALKNEPSTKNLPFNCDGCTRVLPKLTEFASALGIQKQQIEKCEKKVEDLKSSMEKVIAVKVEEAIKQFKEREDRKCNIIMHNIPEPQAECVDKKEEDGSKILHVLDVMGCRDVRIKHFVRLGTPGAKARLIKVQLGSVAEKHQVLGNTKKLRTKDGEEYVHKWSNVYITPDQTKEERECSMKLKKELDRRRKEENKDLIIHRGEIVERKKDSEMAKDGGGPRSSGGRFQK